MSSILKELDIARKNLYYYNRVVFTHYTKLSTYNDLQDIIYNTSGRLIPKAVRTSCYV